MNEIRWNLVAHIRQQIEAGTYVTEKKLHAALLRLVRHSESRRRRSSKADDSQCEPRSTSRPPSGTSPKSDSSPTS